MLGHAFGRISLILVSRVGNMVLKNLSISWLTNLTNWKTMYRSQRYCHTRLHFGFSAKLGIWQVPACKMEPRSGIIFCKNPTRPDPTTQSSLGTCFFFQCCAVSPPQFFPPSIKYVRQYFLKKNLVLWLLRTFVLSAGYCSTRSRHYTWWPTTSRGGGCPWPPRDCKSYLR